MTLSISIYWQGDGQTLNKVINEQQVAVEDIDCVWWLMFQACSLRGHDECLDSKNRGNFLTLVKLLGTYDEKLII